MAGQEIDRCVHELKTVNPSHTEKVAELQLTIRRNETLGTWIAEILHLGAEAKGILAEEH